MIDKIIVRDNNNLLKITDPTVFTHPLNTTGRNWHLNNSSQTLPGYHPKVTKVFFLPTQSCPYIVNTLELEFSLPKILFGNNLYELRNADRNQVYQALSNKLLNMKIGNTLTDIRHLDVRYIEYSKNFYTGRIPISYILEELFRAKLAKNPYMNVDRTYYSNGGEKLVFYCQEYAIVFYDKTLEMADKLQNNYGMLDRKVAQWMLSKNPPNILRMEVRFQERTALKNFLTAQNLVPAHKLAYGVFLEDVFSEQISQYVLKHYWTELSKKARLVSPNLFSLSYELLQIYKSSPVTKRSQAQAFLAKLGLRCLLRACGYIASSHILTRIGCSKPSYYLNGYLRRAFKPSRRMDVFAFITGALTRFSCLSRRKWMSLKPKPSAPWYYKQEKLLTPNAVAEWLAIPRKQVIALIQAGELVAKIIKKGVYRVQRHAVLEYLSG